MTSDLVVYLVEDDASMRRSLRRAINSMGWQVEEFESGDDFLAEFDPNRPGCIVLDVRMTGITGLTVQDRLCEMGSCTPIIFITGFAEVPAAVKAMKAGAVDFIEKPFPEQTLLAAIEIAMARDKGDRRAWVERRTVAERYDRLTRRGHEVVRHVVAGRTNKQIAALLQVSPQTIDAHRAKAMQTLHVDSVAELVRTVVQMQDHRAKSGSTGLSSALAANHA